MKRFLGAMAAMLATVSAAQASLIISEVVDGDLSGGNPKFVEITNTSGSDYTFPVGGGVIVQSNDGVGTALSVNMAGTTILAGQSYVVASSANDGINQYNIAYGAAADLFTPAFFGNGDDRYMITDGTNVLDIYGTFGSRAAPDLATYNYLDGYSYRLPSYIAGTGTTYNASEWFVGGVDSLDGGLAADDIIRLQTLTTPGSHVFVPEPASVLLLSLGALALRRR